MQNTEENQTADYSNAENTANLTWSAEICSAQIPYWLQTAVCSFIDRTSMLVFWCHNCIL